MHCLESCTIRVTGWELVSILADRVEYVGTGVLYGETYLIPPDVSLALLPQPGSFYTRKNSFQKRVRE